MSPTKKPTTIDIKLDDPFDDISIPLQDWTDSPMNRKAMLSGMNRNLNFIMRWTRMVLTPGGRENITPGTP